MEKNILVLNIGSSSKKYSLFSGDKHLYSAHFEKVGDGYVVKYGIENEVASNAFEYGEAVECFYKKVNGLGFVKDRLDVDLVAIRVVAPGTKFQQNCLVDDVYISSLGEVAADGYLHAQIVQEEIVKVRKFLNEVKIVAVSDSAFHSNLPRVSRNYALPKNIIEENDLYRFGYHGLSVAAAARFLKSVNRLESRAIVCHLGSGASVTALINGRSVDTSMGYAPFDGLIMSSRSGNVDPGAVLKLSKKYSPNEIENILYKDSGLLAISNISKDMRDLLALEQKGDKNAELAINSFVYSVKKYIGAYAAAMGGVDAIVFSGTMGIRSEPIRRRICSSMKFLNIELDQDKNKEGQFNKNISTEKSVPVYLVETDEAKEMALVALSFL